MKVILLAFLLLQWYMCILKYFDFTQTAMTPVLQGGLAYGALSAGDVDGDGIVDLAGSGGGTSDGRSRFLLYRQNYTFVFCWIVNSVTFPGMMPQGFLGGKLLLVDI